MSGQSVIDRLNAAKHSIAGQGLAKSVCKSTTEELKPPKRKHLDYLLQCTNEPNVSIPQIADLLIERMQAGNWIVTMKTLITIHNMMNHGNERFCQYLASNNCSLSLDNFMDRSHPQGYEMSTFVKKYAKYINEKAVAYRTMAFDFCKVKRGKDDGLLRTMAVEKLLKALPTLQKQVDVLLEFDATQNDLVNSVISAAHVQLFKDLIRLFACYNDGIINLLEKYFDMHKKQCKEALDLYKKFLVRMDKTSEFLKVAESVGIDRGDIPDLAKILKSNTQDAPASLLEALEAHLAHLEGKKPAAATAAGAHSVAAATVRPSGLTDEEKRRIIEEENRELAKLKEQKARQEVKATVAAPLGHAAPASSASAESKQPAASTAAAAVMSAGAGTAVQAQHRPSEDLLSLDDVNPFKAKVQSVLAAQQTLFLQQQQVASPYGWPAPAAAVPVASMAAAPGTFGMVPAVQQNGMPRNGSFSSEPNFAAAFNGLPRSGAAAGGGSSEGMLRPTRVGAVQHSAAPGTDMFGEVMQPQNKSGQDSSKNQKFVVQGDLDSSLANLAGSLTVGPSQHKKSDFQWTPQPAEKKLTGGNNFSSVQSAPSASTWSLPPQQQPLVTAVPVAMVAPPLVQPQAAYQYPVYGMQAPYGTPIAAPMFMPMQPSVGSPFGVFSAQPQQQQPPSVQLRPQATFTRDPFGAL